MAALEVWGGAEGRRLVTLDGARVAVGASPENCLVIEGDNAVSRRHCMLEHVGGGWILRDLGSRNGTHVNGNRLLGDWALHDGDEVLLGRTRLVYRDPASRGERTTDTTMERPKTTPREHEVLVELCRPLLSGLAFSPPASVKEIAAALFVGEPAVKQHIGNLCDKFGIPVGAGQSRRVLLANAAIESGAVRLADLEGR